MPEHPDARLCRKGPGKEAKLSYMGHALTENRHGLLVDFRVTTAIGTVERDEVTRLIDAARARGFHPKTLGADKGYDTPVGPATPSVKRCANALKKSSAG